MYSMTWDQVSQAVKEGLMTKADVDKWKEVTCRAPVPALTAQDSSSDRQSLGICTAPALRSRIFNTFLVKAMVQKYNGVVATSRSEEMLAAKKASRDRAVRPVQNVPFQLSFKCILAAGKKLQTLDTLESVRLIMIFVSPVFP